MDAAIPLDLQRAEFDQILQSGLLAKAPRLERFLRYVCERHFENSADPVKEYSIAIEALGRLPDFDPKKDSIVRVEAHRLRKRLAAYYAGPGAQHAVHIVIPNGQYRPQFVARQPEFSALPAVERAFPAIEVVTVSPPLAPALPGKRRWLVPLLMLAAVGLAAGGWIFTIRPGSKPAAEVWTGPAADAGGGEVRLLAGFHGPPLTDGQGWRWSPDAFYNGGVSSPVERGHSHKGEADPAFIRAQRSGNFTYAIPLRACSHELHLYFIETEYGAGNPKGGDASSRTFRIEVNGKPVLDGIDPLAEAGAPDRLYERVLKDIWPDDGGKLRLTFSGITGPAFLNAIRVAPAPRGRIHPIRLVAQENPVTDADGRLWTADEYYAGGNSVVRRNPVLNGEEALYQGERYGNFSYRIPVAPGKYRVKLHFAETWFGTPESGEPASDSRIFDVFVNGVALLRNYQVAPDAGGPNRSVEKVFENLTPNAQGLLVLEFVPVKNYAEVNAIEVVETG